MILQLLCIALILGYGYYMWIRGLFESVVMLVCCFFAAGLAVTSYKYMAFATGLDKSQPTFGEPLTLGLLFLITLFLMRFLADRFIKFEMHLPMYTDKSIAAVLGVISGMIMVGIPVAMIQMIPLGDRSVMGYTPFDDNLKGYSKMAPFSPDDFVLGIGGIFSSGSMGTDTPMPTAQEQKLEWFLRRNSAGLGGATLAGQENLVSVKKIYELKGIQIDPISRDPGVKSNTEYKNYVLRCAVDINASDEDKWWRLPATQFALYCRDKKGQTQRYFPIGYIVRCSSKTEPGWAFKMIPEPDEAKKQPLCTLTVQRSEKEASVTEKGLVVSWVYQIPEGVKMTELAFRNDKPVRVLAPKTPQDLPMDVRAFQEAEMFMTTKDDSGFLPVFPKKQADEKFKEKLKKLPTPLVPQTTKDKLVKINERENALGEAVENEAAPAPAPAAAPAPEPAPAAAPAADASSTAGVTFKPNGMYMKCLETGEIFEINPQTAGPEMMGMPGQKLKNPKTGKQTCVMMMRCPACQKYFVPKNAGDPNAMMNAGPLVCPECNIDINQWYRDHRKRRR